MYSYMKNLYISKKLMKIIMKSFKLLEIFYFLKMIKFLANLLIIIK